MKNKLTKVWFVGCADGYGDLLGNVGVFDSKESANKEAERLTKIDNTYCYYVEEFVLNKGLKNNG